jgi:hypothetical protein
VLQFRTYTALVPDPHLFKLKVNFYTGSNFWRIKSTEKVLKGLVSRDCGGLLTVSLDRYEVQRISGSGLFLILL